MFFTKTASTRIKPAQVQDMLANRVPFVLLDVRTRAEHLGGHIPGSTLLPLDQLPAQAESVLPDRNAKIVVYCASGGRSAQAARFLSQQGYTDVSDLGGIMGWPFGIVGG